MKKTLALILAAVMLFSVFVISPISVNAETYTSGDYSYTILNDGTAQITGYQGQASKLTIPSKLDGYSVSSIGRLSFCEYAFLTNLVIPFGITSIEEKAFYGCTNLINVAFSNSLTSIGDFAFQECGSLSSVTIPDSVTTVGSGAFCGCTNITSVIVGKNVASINSWVFEGCEKLISINVDSSNNHFCSTDGNLYDKEKTEIIKYAIGKTDLSFTIPNSVKSIGTRAFSGGKSLTNIILPDGLTYIGIDAFNYCLNLSTINLPESITNIDYAAFWYCKNLSNVTIPHSLNYINMWTFAGCQSLTSITIPDSVTKIGQNAFFDCTNLTSITVYDSVTNIGEYAFGYYYNTDGSSFITTKKESIKIYGYNNTEIENYAIENGFEFISLGDIPTQSTEPSSSETASTEPISSETILTEPSSSENNSTEPSSTRSIDNNGVSEIEALIIEGNSLSSDSSPNAYIWINKVLNTNEKYPSSFVYSKIKSEAEEAQSNTNISTFNCKNKILAYLECLIDEINNIEYKGLSELIEEGNNISDNSSSRAYKWIIDILKTISQYSNSSVYSKIKSEAEEAQSNTNISTFNCKNKILAYLIILKDEIGETQPTEPIETQPLKKDISSWKVEGIKNKTYTGKVIKQSNILVSKDGEYADITVQYRNNVNVGAATVKISGTGNYVGTITKTFKINKANNPMTVKAQKSVTAKAKKKTTIKKAITVKKAQGKIAYKTNNKKVTVKNGTMTVSKGLKKGKTYKVKITIIAKENANYKSAKKTVTVKIKVK